MKYLELITKFWELNNKTPLGASASLLYVFFLNKAYINGNYEFVISDNEIISNLKLSYKTIKSAREKLSSHKLIQYQTNNGIPCHYKILQIFSNKQNLKNVLKDNSNLNNLKKETTLHKPLKHSIKKHSNKTKKSTSTIEISEPIFQNSEVNPNIPGISDFLAYAKTLKSYSTELDNLIELKYNTWIKKGWKNEADRPITNWKAILKSVLPYLSNADESDTQVQLQNIERP